MLRPSLSLAVLGTLGTCVICGFAASWLFDFTCSRGCCSARSSPPRRRGDLRAAPRVDAAAPAGADARGRGGLQRSRRGPPGRRLHRLDRQPGYGVARHGRPVRPRDGDRRGGGLAWAARRVALRHTRLASPGLYPVALYRRPPRSRSARADTLHGSGFLAVYLAGLVLAPAASRRSRRSSPSTRASHGSRRSRCSSRSACSCSRRSSTTSRSRQRRSRSCSCSSRGRWRHFLAAPLAASPRRERLVLGWAGLRGARAGGARDLPGDRRGRAQPRVLQHRLLRGACSRRCCRARRSSGWRGSSA